MYQRHLCSRLCTKVMCIAIRSVQERNMCTDMWWNGMCDKGRQMFSRCVQNQMLSWNFWSECNLCRCWRYILRWHMQHSLSLPRNRSTVSFCFWVRYQMDTISIISMITAQKMKFSITDFFSKCDQIRTFLQNWLHLLKKSLMENFIFCAVWWWTALWNYWTTRLD